MGWQKLKSQLGDTLLLLVLLTFGLFYVIDERVEEWANFIVPWVAIALLYLAVIAGELYLDHGRWSHGSVLIFVVVVGMWLYAGFVLLSREDHSVGETIGGVLGIVGMILYVWQGCGGRLTRFRTDSRQPPPE